MTAEFQVRQQVRTVRRAWLETVASSPFERPARAEYERLKAEHPAEYFELVAVTVTETCLAFTPKTG